MKDVPSATQLPRRNGVYYFRARVRSDIANLLSEKAHELLLLSRRRHGRPPWMKVLVNVDGLPKKEVLISLRTKSYSEAKDRLVDQQVKLREVYKTVRSHFDPELVVSGRDVSYEQIEQLALRYFSQLEHPALKPSSRELMWNEKRSRDEIEADLVDDIVGASQDHDQALSEYGRKAAVLLREGGFRFHEGDEPHQRLTKLIRRAAIENAKRSLDRFNDVYSKQHDVLFPAIPQTEKSAPDARQSIVTLNQLISDFERSCLGHLKPKSLEKYHFLFGVLRELLGGTTDVRLISRQDCKKVSAVLEKLPPNYTKRSVLKDKGVQLAAEYAATHGIPPFSRKTLSDYLSKFSRLFQWALDETLVERHPAKNLVAAKTFEAEEDKVRSFDEALLRRMFEENGTSNILTGCSGSRFWVPLISLFTGLRLNEILQLYVTDIKTEQGVSYFDISLEDENGGRAPDKSLKRVSSRRKVPIHKELVALGFLVFVDSVRHREERRLFYDAPLGKDGMYSSPYSKWFSKRLLALGLKNDRRHSFHSFRHTFRDAMSRAELFSGVVEALGGWAPSKTSDKYGSGLTP